MREINIPKSVMERLPIYLHYLNTLPKNQSIYISSTKIANDLRLGDVQVRKDLALISGKGKPKVGYVKEELESHLRDVLEISKTTNAIIIGSGKLGQALLYYEGFAELGFKIIAAFDNDVNKIDHKLIYNIDNLNNFCENNNIEIGIITVNEENAQEIANLLVKNKIYKIWNFSAVQLNVPENIKVKNENLAASLAVLSLKN